MSPHNPIAEDYSARKFATSFLPASVSTLSGLELHALNRVPPMPSPHDGAAATLLVVHASLQFIAAPPFSSTMSGGMRRRHGHGQPLKHSLVVVDHRAGFSMHEMRRPHHASTKRFADRLMSQAEPSTGMPAKANQVDADPPHVACKAWRNHDPLWPIASLPPR